MAATRVMGALVAAALAVMLAGCAVAGSGPDPEDPLPASSPAATATPSASPPATAFPQPSRRSAALEDQPISASAPPARLEIPDLGIDVAVQPVGLDGQGQMDLFDDPAIAAWYRWGPAPASAEGSTVIAAHVDSLEYDLLPFARLKNAVAGTQIVVTDATGARYGYLVQSVEVTEKSEVDWTAAFDRAGPARLTLVTCGGAFDTENRRYLSNLVLTASRVG